MAISKILEENLEKMLGNDGISSKFHKHLVTESVGGNAGSYFDIDSNKERLCIAGNFHVDEEGRIIEFTNDTCPEGTYSLGFRLVTDNSYAAGYSKIVDCYCYSSEKLPSKLKNVIAGTVMGYNYKVGKTKKEQN